MKIIGLTGGMGSGKSYCAKFFEWLDIPVYYSDAEAKRLMVQNEKLKREIVNLFGSSSYSEKGELNRVYLADKIFNSPDLLSRMNALVHPAVREDFFQWCGDHFSKPYVIQESAILMQTGAYKFFDQMILVDAPLEIRINRIKDRDGITEEEILERMSSQWPSSKTRPLADFIIENDGKRSVLRQVYQIHQEVLKSVSGHKEE